MKESLMKQAITDLRENTCSCVVCADDRILFAEKGDGLAPLFAVYLENREQLAGAYAFDKAVGTAAASLLVDAGVALVYGETMSFGAKQILAEADIETVCEKLVPAILNREGIGLCPLEKLLIDVPDNKDRVEKLRTFAESNQI
ncbi:DUF1893 domain-containing protein [Christensenellaceae bacterium OttesenSCG-928-K19]|nr:DUF1893 domain-containing protein [Christensenellaceae bacterium OttesenSCG-928-K19]